VGVRVPDAKALQSIVDYSRSSSTSGSAAIDPAFDVTAVTNEASRPDYATYWTSTTHLSLVKDSPAGSALYVAFGRANRIDNIVRLVRDA
jgi:hypothetical protein